MKESYQSRKIIDPEQYCIEFVHNIRDDNFHKVGIRINLIFKNTGEIRQRDISLDKIVRRCFGKKGIKDVALIEVKK